MTMVHVVDNCVANVLEDQPNLNLEVALVWTVSATITMVHGWSPYQLVFVSNPNIPSVVTDKPTA